jgi:CDP-6-deoxy-D-xylo-4-hexulose-3-dehydrase
LVGKSIENNEIDALSEWLKTHPRLSKGELCMEFERKFAEWIGADYAIFVNSGSSAILLSLICMNERVPTDKPKKIVVPALAWSTDLAPVMQLGMEPILCDCNLDDLSVDLDRLEYIFKKNDPYGLILVSVLGLVPQMEEISHLCSKYNVFLIEDICESLGSAYYKTTRAQKLGTFGKLSAVSFYFSHHICTIEGGMIMTNSKEYANLLYATRSHGWIRDCDEDYKKSHALEWHISEFNEMFTFYYPGCNFRGNEIGGFIGLKQLEKLDSCIAKRNYNYTKYKSLLEKKHWVPRDCGTVSPLAYPILVNNRDFVYKKLQLKGIESRPLIAGSMGRQPLYMRKYGVKSLKNADIVHKYGMYLPCNPSLSEEEIETVCNELEDRFAYETIGSN